MKKYLALILALCMVFALCACGSSSGDSDTPAASTCCISGCRCYRRSRS